ncbi:MAG: TIGR02302 family protein [Alphaproteobacteria bacterium]
MTVSPDPSRAAGAPDLPPGLDGRLWLARGALFWEKLWPDLWPALGIAGLFLVVALFDLLPGLPLWAHIAALVLFAAALLAALWRALRRLRWPGFGLARRRIETESGLTHRPLAALRDKLAAGAEDPAAAALWALHQQRARASIERLRVGLPAPGLAKRDPYALRAGLVLVLAVGIVVAWSDGRNRLARALLPGSAAAAAQLALDVWITPPAYTGLAPIHLTRAATPAQTAAAPVAPDQNGPIAVPVGATVLAQLQGGRKPPSLALGDWRQEFAAVDSASFRLSAALGEPSDGAQRLSVTQNGREVAGWSVTVLPDLDPEIAMPALPGRTERGALRLAYEGSDDYGIVGLQAVIRRAATNDGIAAPPLTLDLALGRGVAQTVDGRKTMNVKGSAFHDLTPHPWAGLPVTLQLVAKDALGQVGVTEPIPFVLPEREFQHPVARAIVELRKLLALSPRNRNAVRNGLTDIAEAPQAFGHDTVVFLALRAASARLRHNGDEATIASTQSLLWDTALRIEDGRLSLVERELRDIQRALQDALQRNAPQSEIDRLIDQLQQALNRMIEQMMRNAQNMPPQQMPFDPNARYVSSDELQRMIEAAREAARSGDMDAAREMLSQLQQMLENLQSGQFAQSQQQMQQQQQANEMMRQMQELMRRQRELMEQTYRDAQSQRGQNQQGQQGRNQQGQNQQGQQGQNGQQSQAEQEALRRMLGEMMRQLGEMGGQIPEGFGNAERSMNDAGQALGSGQPGQALGPQANALEQLQQGAGEMMQQLQQMMGQGQGPGQGQPGSQMGQGQPGRPGGPSMPRPGDPRNFDPLGRQPPSSGVAGEDTLGHELPKAGDLMRSREILEELRRRAGEAERPRLELDYIDRLLRRF